jgi:hypothetical protein
LSTKSETDGPSKNRAHRWFPTLTQTSTHHSSYHLSHNIAVYHLNLRSTVVENVDSGVVGLVEGAVEVSDPRSNG